MSTRAASPAAPVARRGFTIVEMLVTLTLVLIVGAAISGVFVRQLRGYSRTVSASGAQRDLRLGLSLLPMDLRAASVQLADIRDMSDSAITLRATIGSSVACERPDSTTIILPPTNLAKNILTSWYSQPVQGDWITVYVSSDLDPSKDSWRLLHVVKIDAAPATSCAGAPFTDPVLDPPASKPRWRIKLDDTLSTTDAGPGKPIRFLRLTRYSLYRPSPGSGKWYLGFRDSTSVGWSAVEPIAGPFAAYSSTAGGVRFTYFDTLGAALVNPPAGARIGRVDVALRTLDRVRGGKDSLIVRDSLKLRIALRNRQTQ
jgi:prepilin-type N-terminal cleavage/methylation domain-containing protein